MNKKIFLSKIARKISVIAFSMGIITAIGGLSAKIQCVYGENAEYSWKIEDDGNIYWYENDKKQGIEGRGKEIYDESTNAWYWLDAAQGGAVTKNKDVYQESLAGTFGDHKVYKGDGSIDINANTGKWVRYDENGHMVKGWDQNIKGWYYFDPIYGTMAKGYATIDDTEYYFNTDTGVLERTVANGISTDFTGWKYVEGKDIWYENGIRQGYSTDSSYRGKEIYDKSTDAWYWLDNVEDGKKAVSKDVYQESFAGDWGENVDNDGKRVGKWVRYNAEGKMIKGWNENENGKYYFDSIYGTMAKGNVTIDGNEYFFDMNTGICEKSTDKKTIHYETYKEFINDKLKVEERGKYYTCTEYLKMLSDGEKIQKKTEMYIDYDSDGEDELLVKGGRNFVLVDVREGILTVVESETQWTTVRDCIFEIEGEYYMGQTDTTHGGRQLYYLQRFDHDGNVVSNFYLSAEYYGKRTYDENSIFKLNDNTITMQEYEEWLRKMEYVV